jgi:BlaI family penicillinase repressor
MTRRPKTSRLSAGEMEILEMLWRLGPVALSEAQAGLGRAVGYTTVQTRLNRLVEKGLVSRTTDRPAQYAAAVLADQVSASHLDQLVEWVSGGKVVPLVAHLMRDRRLSQAEIAELKRLVSEAEQAETKSARAARRSGKKMD